MILKDFLENPAGKGDSSMTNRAMLRSMLDSKYDKLVQNKQIKHTIYRMLNQDTYFVHPVIPTETERDNSYDVVFKFTGTVDTKSDISLNNYNVRMFCNAPSFAYTFARVYIKEDLMVPELIEKFPKEITQFDPEVRNRYGIVNYDKYLYFGAKYVVESRMLSKTTINIRSVSYSDLVFKQRVRSFDKIMNEYRRAKNKLTENKKAEKKNINKPTRSTDATGKVEKKTGKSRKTVATAKTVKPKRKK